MLDHVTDAHECDIEEWSKTEKGLRPDQAKKFRIRIDGEKFKTEDPMVTGRQILDLASIRPAEEHLVFQILKSGMLEEIRLDETVDLRTPGLERFKTFKSDASYRFMMDGRRFEWGATEITGLTLKKLAGVDPNSFDVWLEIKGQEDQLVENTDFVDLTAKGIEKFFTGKKTTTEGQS